MVAEESQLCQPELSILWLSFDRIPEIFIMKQQFRLLLFNELVVGENKTMQNAIRETRKM